MTLVVFAGSVVACGGPGAGTAAYIKSSGKLLREYDEGGAHFFVIQSTDKLVRKWRQSGGAAEVRAEVDTGTNVCKLSEKVVDCDTLKDPDLTPFVKPGGPAAGSPAE